MSSCMTYGVRQSFNNRDLERYDKPVDKEAYGQRYYHQQGSQQTRRVEGARQGAFAGSSQMRPMAQVHPENKRINNELKNANFTKVKRVWNEAKGKKLGFDSVNFSSALNQLSREFRNKRELTREEKGLLNEIVQGFLSHVQECNAWSLANTANALAWLLKKCDCREVYNTILQELKKSEWQKLKECKPQELSNLANAFAKAGIFDEELFREIIHELKRSNWQKLKECNHQELSNLANAYAKAGIFDDQLFSEILHELKRSNWQKLKECNHQGLSNLAWSFAVVGQISVSLFREIFSLLEEKIRASQKLLKEEARQFVHVQLALELEGLSHSVKLGKGMKSELQYWMPHLSERWQSSRTHMQVFQVLQQIIPEKIKNEVYTDGLSCDMIFDDVIVFEVHGPTHYLPSRQLNGESLFKIRLLSKLNYGVIIIPYWEWDILAKKTVSEQKAYLEIRLQQLRTCEHTHQVSISSDEKDEVARKQLEVQTIE